MAIPTWKNLEGFGQSHLSMLTADQVNKACWRGGMLPPQPCFSSREDGRGGGVGDSVLLGWIAGSTMICPHLRLHSCTPHLHPGTSHHHLSGRSLLASPLLLSVLVPSYPPATQQPDSTTSNEARTCPFSAPNLHQLPYHTFTCVFAQPQFF